MAVENIGNLVPTKIPALIDDANIQDALKAYHYGSYDFDTAETDATELLNPSIAYTINNLQTQITAIDLSTALLKTDFAAKGDLLSASANDTLSVLTVGSNGTVLTANSAAASGLAWTIPDVTLNGTQVSTPFVNLPIPGDTLQYSELQLTYIMDEDMQSWREIYEWMFNLGNPESRNKIGALTQIPGRINSVTSDASLLVKSNSNNPRVKFIFKDIFPTTLGGVTLSSSEGQEFLTSTISFLYSYYSVESI